MTDIIAEKLRGKKAHYYMYINAITLASINEIVSMVKVCNANLE